MSTSRSIGRVSSASDLSITIPSALAAEVWIDFDGTITSKDVLDQLIVNWAADEDWRVAETLWQRGEIGSFQCLTRQFDCVRILPDALDRFVAGIPIDPGANALFDLLRAKAVPTAILSDGVEQFIRPILARAGIIDAVVRSNRIEHLGDRLKLLCPHRSDGCTSAAAHCKCSSMAALGSDDRVSIYIGDGRSDLCPARSADVVFAKGTLAKSLAAEGRTFLMFDTLLDVADQLAQAWRSESASPREDT